MITIATGVSSDFLIDACLLDPCQPERTVPPMNPNVHPAGDSPRLPLRKNSNLKTTGLRWAGGILLVLITTGFLFLLRGRKDPDEVWRNAQAKLQSNRIEEAEQLSDILSRLRPPIDADWMLRAQVAIAQDKPDSALKFLENIPASSRLGPQARLLAGQIELRRGRLRLAERSLLEAIELDPALVQARRELIYIYGFRSQSEAIDQQFRALSERVPLSAQDAFVWSLIRGVQWSPEEIVETLSRAVREDPEDSRSRIALADSLMELTRFDEAEAILNPLDLSDPDFRAARGRLALERGDVEALSNLLSSAPNGHIELELLKGKLKLQQRSPEEAINAFQSALALRPNDREALSGLSQALNQAGKREEAAPIILQLNQVNELNTLLNAYSIDEGPASPGRFLTLARSCEAIGFFPQARAWYQNVISLDPFHSLAQEGLARLGADDPDQSASGSND